MYVDVEYHRKRVRELVLEPPDEPTHCELKRELAYESNEEKAELVKDVVAFSNAPLEHKYVERPAGFDFVTVPVEDSD